MPRAFIGIALPRGVKSTMLQCRDAYLDADPEWRREKWVLEDNLHVTLRFLGNVDDEMAARILEALRATVPAIERYRLYLGRARAVPRPRAASLLWVEGVSGAPETADLAAVISETLAHLGFERDTRAFKTHVTLCRARHLRRASVPALDAMDHVLDRSEERGVSLSVREITLYSSTLTPHGPVYEELGVVPLGE
jgi:2'-5' RNA ligase